MGAVASVPIKAFAGEPTGPVPATDLPPMQQSPEKALASLQGEQSQLEIGTTPNGAFSVDANMVVTGRTCVLGSSGSGKSYAVGVLCEELCRNEVPFAIIDTEGEHTGLKEKFEALWVGDEKGSDLPWTGLDLEDLARQAPDISPLILDVSDLPDPKEKVSAFVGALYQTLTERRTPYLIVVEEADKFIPQTGQRVPIFAEVARRGRKRGMGLMICSQRPSLVDKNVLSQCGNQLIGKLIIQNDLQSVAQFFPRKGLPKELTSLRAGQFYAMGGFSPTPELVSVKQRVTQPGGVTPSLARRVVKKYTGTMDALEVSSGTGEEWTAASGRIGLGFPPSIKAEDIPAMVRRERRFGIFGPRESVTGVAAEFRTLVQLGVRLRRGLLKRRFETVYAYLDGVTGKEVLIRRGLEAVKGFEKLLGLTTLQVEVLREVSADSDTSAIDVASALGESKSTVSRTLSLLNDKRLVRTIEVRNRKLFRRLLDLPGEPSSFAPLELEEVSLEKAKVVPPKVKEADIRDAVKGLWEGADVESFEPFLYPVYKVELVVRRKHRKVLIDGRSGKELAF
jgi:DNA-binding transcriptional ArsR family regulator